MVIVGQGKLSFMAIVICTILNQLEFSRIYCQKLLQIILTTKSANSK